MASKRKPENLDSPLRYPKGRSRWYRSSARIYFSQPSDDHLIHCMGKFIPITSNRVVRKPRVPNMGPCQLFQIPPLVRGDIIASVMRLVWDNPEPTSLDIVAAMNVSYPGSKLTGTKIRVSHLGGSWFVSPVHLTKMAKRMIKRVDPISFGGNNDLAMEM